MYQFVQIQRILLQKYLRIVVYYVSPTSKAYGPVKTMIKYRLIKLIKLQMSCFCPLLLPKFQVRFTKKLV